VKCSLTSGKLADLVLLDCDIFKIDPAQIDKLKVTMTVTDGKVVWEAK
jgi:predicted amidohydrolase YtcJ